MTELDTEGRDLTLVASAVIFGVAAIVFTVAQSVLWIVSVAVAGVLVVSSSRVAQDARARSKAEYNKILAGLEQRDAAERERNEQLAADEAR